MGGGGWVHLDFNVVFVLFDFEIRDWGLEMDKDKDQELDNKRSCFIRKEPFPYHIKMQK